MCEQRRAQDAELLALMQQFGIEQPNSQSRMTFKETMLLRSPEPNFFYEFKKNRTELTRAIEKDRPMWKKQHEALLNHQKHIEQEVKEIEEKRTQKEAALHKKWQQKLKDGDDVVIPPTLKPSLRLYFLQTHRPKTQSLSR